MLKVAAWPGVTRSAQRATIDGNSPAAFLAIRRDLEHLATPFEEFVE
jgi:hypothetical protein